MNKPVIKGCSRCKTEIKCQAFTTTPCRCAQIELSKDCIDYLKETNYDCLCNDCLETLNSLVDKAHNSPSSPTENIHYYMENGLLVFTELNHIKRGYCCKSNCRHCAYGFLLEE